MPGQAQAWWDDLRQEAELPPEPARPRGPLILAAAAVAVAISGGLAWWLTTAAPSSFRNPPTAVFRPEPAPVRLAGSAADEAQVRRAYEEFGLVYANSGPDGLARFSDTCAQSLAADPRILDFCLALDLFAEAVAAPPNADLAGQAEARRVALVQTALPLENHPEARIAEVRRLTRVVSGVAQTTAAMPAATPPVRDPAAQANRPAPARLAKADPPRRSAAAKSSPASDCGSRATSADRLICANPALQIQDRRMREAYERALAAGANPLEVDRGQALWRAVRDDAGNEAELAELYARRTRELNAAAASAALTPPS